MDEIKETLNVDKAFLDAGPPGLNITIDSSAATGGLALATIANTLGELVVRMGNAHPPLALCPCPLRYILATANLDDAVNTWNRFNGLPEACVSKQASTSPGVERSKHVRALYTGIRRLWSNKSARATLAQLVERRFCKPRVSGSSPEGGSIPFYQLSAHGQRIVTFFVTQLNNSL
jgi:hypothetical protein